MVILKRLHWTFTITLVLAALDEQPGDGENGVVADTPMTSEDNQQGKAPETVRLETLETNYVQNFGNTGKTVIWSLIKYAYDFQKMVQICDQLKTLRNITARISNASVSQGTLYFRNEEYKTRKIDVLACKIANTEGLPTARRYVHITKGKEENSYYLLTKIEEEVGKDGYYLEWYKVVADELKEAGNEGDELSPKVARDIWTPDL